MFGPDAVWFGSTVMVPVTLARFEPAPVVSYWTVTGLTAVPTGWTVISPLTSFTPVSTSAVKPTRQVAPALVSVVYR